jgi:hypothetical protein
LTFITASIPESPSIRLFARLIKNLSPDTPASPPGDMAVCP